MSTALPWLGALGGLAAFLAGVGALLRGIFKQVNATDNNTGAIEQLTRRIDNLASDVEQNTDRITRLEAYRGPGPGPGPARRRPGR